MSSSSPTSSSASGDAPNSTGKALTIYALKTCDTCKKAIKALAAAGYDLTVIDVRSDGVPEAVLAQLLETHGADIVVNKKSTTWRALDEGERASDPLTLLKSHSTLLKRPVIINPIINQASTPDSTPDYNAPGSYIGWSRDTQAAFGV